MNGHPKISIIVSVFNTENYLSKCLDSLVNQTFSDIEIICIDDGSTDNSIGILRQYAGKDERIKIISGRNEGAAAARNKGLKAALSPYITFVDSDDYLELDALEKVFNAMFLDNRIDGIVYYGKVETDDIDFKDDRITDACNYHRIRREGLFESTDALMVGTPLVPWNRLYKKSIIDEYNLSFPEGLVYEDNEFVFKYVVRCRYVYYIGEYLYHYLQRKNSVMSNLLEKDNKRLTDGIKVANSVYEYYVQNNLLTEHKRSLSYIFYWTMNADFRKAPLSKKIYVLNFIRKILMQIDLSFLDGANKTEKSIKYFTTRKYHKIEKIKIKRSFSCKFATILFYENRVLFEILGLNFGFNFGKIFSAFEKIISVKNESFYKRIRILFFSFKVIRAKHLISQIIRYQQDILYLKVNSSSYENYLKEYFKGNVDSLGSLQYNSGIPSDFYKTNKYNYDLQDILSKFSSFYFCPNYTGDIAIAKAQYQFFSFNRFKYSALSVEQVEISNDESFNFVYGGGEISCKNWNYQEVLDFFNKANIKSGVILPSSFSNCDDFLQALDERWVVFCREKKSLDYCLSKNKKAHFSFADDMAFLLDINSAKEIPYEISEINIGELALLSELSRTEIYDKYIKHKLLYYKVRESLVKSLNILESGKVSAHFLSGNFMASRNLEINSNIDLSVYFDYSGIDKGIVNVYSCTLINAIDCADIIVTDRLNIAVIAALLKKEVYIPSDLFETYKMSMRDMPNILSFDDLGDIQKTGIPAFAGMTDKTGISALAGMTDKTKMSRFDAYSHGLTDHSKKTEGVANFSFFEKQMTMREFLHIYFGNFLDTFSLSRRT